MKQNLGVSVGCVDGRDISEAGFGAGGGAGRGAARAQKSPARVVVGQCKRRANIQAAQVYTVEEIVAMFRLVKTAL